MKSSLKFLFSLFMLFLALLFSCPNPVGSNPNITKNPLIGGNHTGSPSGRYDSPASEAYQFFGNSVAVSGLYAVVGAPQTTVAGKSGQGSAYVYHYETSAWVLRATITSSDGKAYDNFGTSVAIVGDDGITSEDYGYIAVGAPGAAGGNGNAFTHAGAVYVFERATASTTAADSGNETWTQVKKLTDTSTIAGNYDKFGCSVAIIQRPVTWKELRVIVGAKNSSFYGWDILSGSATIFTSTSVLANPWSSQRLGENFAPTMTYTTPDYFGASVAMDGDYAVIGAPGDRYPSMTISATGQTAVNSMGAAYIYKYIGSPTYAWVFQKRITELDSGSPNHEPQINDSFGNAVAVTSAGDTVAVGAYRQGWDTTLPSQELTYGAVYLFKASDQSFVYKLGASDQASGDTFGTSVSVYATGTGNVYVAAGAPFRTDGTATNAGGVYIYNGSGSSWTQSILTASDPQNYDWLGSSVCITNINGSTFGVLSGAPDASVAHTQDGTVYSWQGSATTWTQK